MFDHRPLPTHGRAQAILTTAPVFAQVATPHHPNFFPPIKKRLFKSRVKSVHLCVPKVEQSPRQVCRRAYQDVITAVAPAATLPCAFKRRADAFFCEPLHPLIETHKRQGHLFDPSSKPSWKPSFQQSFLRGWLGSFASSFEELYKERMIFFHDFPYKVSAKGPYETEERSLPRFLAKCHPLRKIFFFLAFSPGYGIIKSQKLAYMKSTSATHQLSWAKRIWPIERSELKKIIPLLILKFLVSMIYSILTNMKDPVVVTAKQSGAEVIPVIKAWIVFPLSILCAVAYSKLSNCVKRSTLFYGIISFFLVISAIYGFILYPHAEMFTPVQSAQWLTGHLGAHHNHWVSIYRNWMHTLFFALAELWGQVVILTLYWSFANHICRIKEAKRTYAFFIAAGDLGTIFAPLLVLHYVRSYGQAHFSLTVQALISYVLFFGVLILIFYWWMQKYVLTDKKYYNPLLTKHSVNEKTKLSLSKSIRHIFSSKYLLAIAAMVISVALTVSIVEVTWKAHLKKLYPDVAAYQAFNAKQIFWVGVFAFITAVFFGTGLLRRFGWLFSAQITPIAIGVTSSIFFLLCIFKDHLTPLASFFWHDSPFLYCSFWGLPSYC